MREREKGGMNEHERATRGRGMGNVGGGETEERGERKVRKQRGQREMKERREGATARGKWMKVREANRGRRRRKEGGR